jgi:hypothetical protein
MAVPKKKTSKARRSRRLPQLRPATRAAQGLPRLRFLQGPHGGRRGGHLGSDKAYQCVSR